MVVRWRMATGPVLPAEEEDGARLMTAVARNASLALSPAELTTLRDDDLIEVPGVHPFHPTGRGPAFGGSEVGAYVARASKARSLA